MCIICASAAGRPQPTTEQLHTMFQRNPHGAGYMTARGGAVKISKGFMNWEDFIHAANYERFTESDSVIYHFRISTQAGVTPQMCHPFPLCRDINAMKLLDLSCPIGVAHNGVIQLTADRRDTEYSDTARYVADILSHLVRCPEDLRDPGVLRAIELTAGSKLALMDSTGYIATVGNFVEDSGLLFSNSTYQPFLEDRRRFTIRGW